MHARDPGSAAVLAPHPMLRRYYAHEKNKRSFIRGIFDSGAGDYDRVERAMSLGTGSWYRRQALARAGLTRGMRVLDVAVGTGLVAREAATLTGDSRRVLGIDPSANMLAQAARQLAIRCVRGVGEQLPVASDAFDFLSMGYALRHLNDLSAAFGEFHRVLRPGGKICVLEITRPSGRVSGALLRGYMQAIVPLLSRLASRRPDSLLLWQYYWDTIEACVRPQAVLQAMRDGGFIHVEHRVELGVFSEYVGQKPDALPNPG